LHLVRQGLAATAPLWPPIQAAYTVVHQAAYTVVHQAAYTVVHQAAHLLANHAQRDAAARRQASEEQVLAPLRTPPADWGSLAPAAAHFVTVTASYWPGLFHC
jgi:hypothetical protein